MIRAILLDIEGTVAPISFVKDILFPYSKEKMKDFINKNKDNPEIKKILDEVRQIEGKNLTDEEVVETLKKWVDEDKKIAPLKEIQGMIWKEGFEKGHLKAPIYEDAYKKMKQWKEKGIPMYIYSSGSIEAQKLFFSYTNYGNLLSWFKGHFDTRTAGNKKEKQSYEKIAKEIGLKQQEILFLSDNLDEIKAASEAGFQVIKVSRPEDAPYIEDLPFRQIKSFEELNYQFMC
jgi:enolase-phosphatase E1